VTLSMTFGASNNVQLVKENSTSTLALPLTLTSGAWMTSSIGLPQGLSTTTLILQSSLDGNYTLAIYRTLQDLIEIDVMGYNVLNNHSTPLLIEQVIMSSHTFQFNVTFPYQVVACRVRLQYSTNDTITLVYNGVTSAAAISGTESTERFDLAVAPTNNVLTVHSTLDGNYTLYITRSPPTMRSITVQAGSGNSGVEYGGEIELDQPFVPGQMDGYSTTVPYVVTSLILAAEWSEGSVSVSINGAPAISLVASSSFSQPLSLPVGVSSIEFISSFDGNYSLEVTRLEQDVRELQITGATTEQPPSYPVVTILLNPSWRSDQFNFSIDVPYMIDRISFRVLFDWTGNVTLIPPQSSAALPVVSGIYSTLIPLLYPPAASLFRLISLRDGSYNISVRRLGPDLTQCLLFAHSLDGTNSSTPLNFTPAFEPGAGYEYKLSVPYTVDALAMEVVFSVVGTVKLQLTGTYEVVLTSGVRTGLLSLKTQPETNSWRLTSQRDGSYSLLITRASSNPCQSGTTRCLNGGTCIPAPAPDYSNYTCECSYGFSGADCSESSFDTGPLPGVSSPVARLSAPSVVGSCDTLLLDGSGSYGFGSNIDAVTYVWHLDSITLQTGQTIYSNFTASGARLTPSGVVYSSNSSSMPLQPLHPFNETLGVTMGRFVFGSSDPSQISMPAYMLIDNATHTFSLTVSDGSDRPTSTATVQVAKEVTDALPWLPQVNILTPARVTTDIQTQVRVAIIPATCQPLPSDVTYTFQWSVQTMDGNATTVYNAHTKLLAIPPHTLDAGSSYLVQLDMTASSVSAGTPSARRRLLAAATGVSSGSAVMYVDRQELEAAIVGSYRQKTVGMPFTLDGSISRDPDWNGATPPPYPFGFQWSARYIPYPNVDNVPSQPVTLPAGNATTQPLLRIPSNFFTDLVAASSSSSSSGIRMTFSIMISALDGRNDSTSVDVDLMPQPTIPVPAVSIINAPSNINPNQALTLIGALYSSLTPANDLLLAWRCESHPSLSLIDPSIIATSPNSSNLIVRSNVLQPGYYTFSLTATEPNYANYTPPVQTTARAVIYVNSPPVPGSCSVYPTNGEALSTQFQVLCKQWSDVQGLEPLTYAYSYFDPDNDPLLQSPKLLAPASPSYSFSTLLPAGHLVLQASIFNSAGAKSIFNVPVNVTWPASALEDPACYVSNMTNGLLDSALSQQDSDAAFLLIQSLSGVLNSINSTSGSNSSSSSCNAPSTDDLRGSLLDSLSNLVNSAGTNGSMSEDTAKQVAQTLEELTHDSTAFNDTDKWQQAQDLLEDAIDAIPPAGTGSGDSGSLTDDLASTVSNLLIDCSKLDDVSSLTQLLLSAILNGTVANSASNSLDTENLDASATRTTVEDGTQVTLPNGISVTLTAEALAQYAEDHPVTPENIDTAAAQLALALDTRIVTFNPRWTNCRNTSDSGTDVVSEITTIDITLSNGEVVDISELNGPIEFLVPLRSNHSLPAPPDPKCPDGQTAVAPVDPTSALTCSFWDVANQTWSNEGCRNLGYAANKTAIKCSCGHTTEFAILYHAEKAAAGGCESIESELGLFYYLIFFSLYMLVASISAFQLARILRSTRCKHWLMSVEHGLVMCVGLFRAWNMINYYVLYQYIPLLHITIISGVPHLFTSWIFTFVIFAWAAIYHSSIAGKRDENPFREYQSRFIALNATISVALFTLFVLMSQSHDLDQQELYFQAGVTIIAVVSICFAVFFIVYGVLIVRSLTRDFASPYARKLFIVAVAFSCGFFASSGILLVSVLDSSLHNSYLIVFNCAYFSLDIVVLGIVLGLFKKSVGESIRAARKAKAQEEGGGSVLRSTATMVSRRGGRSTTLQQSTMLNNRTMQSRKSTAAVAQDQQAVEMATLDDKDVSAIEEGQVKWDGSRSHAWKEQETLVPPAPPSATGSGPFCKPASRTHSPGLDATSTSPAAMASPATSRPVSSGLAGARTFVPPGASTVSALDSHKSQVSSMKGAKLDIRLPGATKAGKTTNNVGRPGTSDREMMDYFENEGSLKNDEDTHTPLIPPHPSGFTATTSSITTPAQSQTLPVTSRNLHLQLLSPPSGLQLGKNSFVRRIRSDEEDLDDDDADEEQGQEREQLEVVSAESNLSSTSEPSSAALPHQHSSADTTTMTKKKRPSIPCSKRAQIGHTHSDIHRSNILPPLMDLPESKQPTSFRKGSGGDSASAREQLTPIFPSPSTRNRTHLPNITYSPESSPIADPNTAPSPHHLGGNGKNLALPITPSSKILNSSSSIPSHPYPSAPIAPVPMSLEALSATSGPGSSSSANLAWLAAQSGMLIDTVSMTPITLDERQSGMQMDFISPLSSISPMTAGPGAVAPETSPDKNDGVMPFTSNTAPSSASSCTSSSSSLSASPCTASGLDLKFVGDGWKSNGHGHGHASSSATVGRHRPLAMSHDHVPTNEIERHAQRPPVTRPRTITIATNPPKGTMMPASAAVAAESKVAQPAGKALVTRTLSLSSLSISTIPLTPLDYQPPSASVTTARSSTPTATTATSAATGTGTGTTTGTATATVAANPTTSTAPTTTTSASASASTSASAALRLDACVGVRPTRSES